MNASLFDLAGRTALVTGGGSGLGYAIARAFAGAGAKVVLLGRNVDNLRRSEAEIATAGGRAAHVVCDLVEANSIRPTVEQVELEHGAIDILVNNAGINQRSSLTEFPKDGWDRMIAVHLSAPFLLAQAVAAGMIARRAGKIINVASIMSELARPTIIPYAAAKGGLKMLTRALAVELAPAQHPGQRHRPGLLQDRDEHGADREPGIRRLGQAPDTRRTLGRARRACRHRAAARFVLPPTTSTARSSSSTAASPRRCEGARACGKL